MTISPVVLLHLLGLAAIGVTSSTTTITDPLPTLGPQKNYGEPPTDSKGRPPVVKRGRLGNGTLSTYSWLEDPFQVDATPDDDDEDDDVHGDNNDVNGNKTSNSRLLKRKMRKGTKKLWDMQHKIDMKEVENIQAQVEEADAERRWCPQASYICDPDWNHAYTEACDILIADNLKQVRLLPIWTYSLCYALDWDYWGDYQCCVSWTDRTDEFNTTALLPVVNELFTRCQFWVERLGYHVVSGRAIHSKLGGMCGTQCLSNRNQHCQ